MNLLEDIKKIIEEDVKPYLSSHGGAVEIVSVEDGTVKVRLTGNCSGCPSSRLTVEDIIKTALVGRVSGILDVELETGISPEILDFARKILKKIR